MELIIQLKRAWAVAKKDIRIYYFKGPVLIFGLLFPLFLFLAFYIGRDLSADFLIPGLIGMALFFTATSVGPVIFPWETRMRTLERLVSAPIGLGAILLGDVLASLIFGILISLVPLLIGFPLGVEVRHPATFAGSLILAALCLFLWGVAFRPAHRCPGQRDDAFLPSQVSLDLYQRDIRAFGEASGMGPCPGFCLTAYLLHRPHEVLAWEHPLPPCCA